MQPALFAPGDLVPVDRAATVRRLPRVPRDDDPNFPTLFGRQVPAKGPGGYFTWDGPSKSWEPHLNAAGEATVRAHYAAHPCPVVVLSKAAPPVFAALNVGGPVTDDGHEIHADVYFALRRAAVSWRAELATFSTYSVFHIRKTADAFLHARMKALRRGRVAEITHFDADPRGGRAAELYEVREALGILLPRAAASERRLLKVVAGVGRRKPVPVKVLAKRLGCSRQTLDKRITAARLACRPADWAE